MSATPYNTSNWLSRLPDTLLSQRKMVLGLILSVALIGFEIFNYSTTDMALSDLLGGLTFAGIRWATILAIAFCGIDFAGIARLFLPDPEKNKSNETWYLMGAWLLAATMNAILTWWAVSLGLVSRSLQSSAFIPTQTLSEVVPVFIALLVWVTRILLIGSFSLASERVFSADSRAVQSVRPQPAARTAREQFNPLQPLPLSRSNNPRPTPRPAPKPAAPSRREPEYVPDPSYSPAQPAFQTLAGRHNSTNQPTQV